jgi:hypothetical protein
MGRDAGRAQGNSGQGRPSEVDDDGEGEEREEDRCGEPLRTLSGGTAEGGGQGASNRTYPSQAYTCPPGLTNAMA